ncbi:MAG: glycosyltransferase family 1 protein [Aquabacterium sp.]|uniref:glycosyltransferase n=1 Tax=Aquabacterium sp. TaxID=1872578 RepID=UPI00121CF961|nr:glycosyltransferase [Aquabacterium sp.]TAK93181.1 MAG: glycosyltransferase family 1 protein [Aquabacterium sp.]
MTNSAGTVQVLHCAETIKGGVATYLRELLVCQARDFGGGSVAVVVPESQVSELPVPPGVLVITFPDKCGRAINAMQLGLAVARFVRRHQPRVVHAHSTYAGAVVRPLLAAMGMASRVVYCPHGWAWDRGMGPMAFKLTQCVERVLARMGGKVVCISEHERHSALEAGLNPEQLHVVLNGVAEKAPAPQGMEPAWPQGRKRLLFVGRFDRQKGVDLFCAALRELGDEAYGVLAGDFVLNDAQMFDLPGNAESVGWINSARLQTLFNSADVLVMPSRWEGFGLTAAEAMRAGVPVLASRVGGLPEVVAHGETGLLVEPGDVSAIVDAVRRHTADEWRTMGSAGRDRFERMFTMERVHTQLRGLYAIQSDCISPMSCAR